MSDLPPDRAELSALTALHARCVRRAREHEAAASRLMFDDPRRAELSGDLAAEARAEARALARLLAPHGVNTPPEDQLSLWADGGGPPS